MSSVLSRSSFGLSLRRAYTAQSSETGFIKRQLHRLRSLFGVSSTKEDDMDRGTETNLPSIPGVKMRRKDTCLSSNTLFASLRFFIAVVASLFLVRAVLVQYANDVIYQAGRRYEMNNSELNFILGLDKVGLVCSILFVAFFGNRLHRPRAMAVGAFFSAFGSLLSASAYMESGSRQKQLGLSEFLKAGVCLRHISNISYISQCDYHAASGQHSTVAFTVLCLGSLFCGIGAAFYLSLSLVHIEENCKPKYALISIGILISITGIGQILGTSLASLFSETPESGSGGDVGMLSDLEKVGAWWFGYIFLACIFTILGVCLLLIPKFHNEPNWLVRRRLRLKEKVLKKLSTKKKRRVLGSKHKKRIRRSTQNKDRKTVIEDKPNAETDPGVKCDEDLQKSSGLINVAFEMENDTAGGEDKAVIDGNMKQHQNPQSHVEISASQNKKSAPSRKKLSEKEKRNHNKQAALKNTERLKILKKYIMRREVIKDFPRHIWRLVRTIPLMLALVGSSLASALLAGLIHETPHYIQINFLAGQSLTNISPTFSIGFGWVIGTGIGLLYTLYFKLSVAKSTRIVMVGLTVSILMTACMVAVDCDNTVVVRIDSELNEEERCNSNCDCTDIQYDPVCTSDGLTFPSPCHAGCDTLEVLDNHWEYTGCSCSSDGRATYGSCDSPCVIHPLYLFFVFIAVAGVTTGYIPILMIFYRSIKDRFKSVSIGFLIWVIYLFAFILAPVIYKYIRDGSCLLKTKDCNEQVKCWMYDLISYRVKYHLVALFLALIGLLVFLVLIYLLNKKNSTIKLTKPEDPTVHITPQNSTQEFTEVQNTQVGAKNENAEPHIMVQSGSEPQNIMRQSSFNEQMAMPHNNSQVSLSGGFVAQSPHGSRLSLNAGYLAQVPHLNGQSPTNGRHPIPPNLSQPSLNTGFSTPDLHLHRQQSLDERYHVPNQSLGNSMQTEFPVINHLRRQLSMK